MASRNICSDFLDMQENKQLCLAAVPNQKQCLWTPVYQHCNCGIVFQKHFRIPVLRRTSRAHAANVTRYLNPLITCHLLRLTAFHAAFQRFHSFPARLSIFEDSGAVIRVIIKRSQSPFESWRHVSRTHRVDLDLLLDRIKLDSSIST